MRTPAWLSQVCTVTDKYVGSIGVCECNQDTLIEGDCFSKQLVYRTGASSLTVFSFLLLLCVSGCASEAATSLPVLKFFALFFLLLFSLFMPNGFFAGFGALVAVLAAAFSVGQNVWLVDAMIMADNRCYATFMRAQRQHPTTRAGYGWLIGELALSATFFVLSCVLMWHLSVEFPGSGQRVASIGAFCTSLLLLFLAITDWCKHGALMPSCAVMLFTEYLAWVALATGSQDQADAGGPPTWLSLVLGVLALLYLVCGQAEEASSPLSGRLETAVELPVVQPAGGGAGGGGGSDAASTTESSSGGTSLDDSTKHDFGVQCAMHALAAAYVTSALAPQSGLAVAVARYAALVLALASYGWTLIAPLVLTNRDFNF